MSICINKNGLREGGGRKYIVILSKKIRKEIIRNMYILLFWIFLYLAALFRDMKKDVENIDMMNCFNQNVMWNIYYAAEPI